LNSICKWKQERILFPPLNNLKRKIKLEKKGSLKNLSLVWNKAQSSLPLQDEFSLLPDRRRGLTETLMGSLVVQGDTRY